MDSLFYYLLTALLLVFIGLYLIKRYHQVKSSLSPSVRLIYLSLSSLVMIFLGMLIFSVNAPISEQLYATLITSDNDSDIILPDRTTYRLRAGDVAERTNPNNLVDPNELLLRQPKLEHIDITGDGLYLNQLESFSISSVGFEPSEVIDGFILNEVSYPQQLGDSLIIYGGYQSKDTEHIENTQILVVDLSKEVIARGIEYSLVNDNQNASINTFQFKVQLTPKLYGKQELFLQARIGDSIVASEPLFFYFEKQQAFNALLLQSSPSFEFNHLKHWLSSNGAKIDVEIKISKYANKSLQIDSEKSNNKANLKTQTKSLNDREQRFDLVIADLSRLSELTTIEIKQLILEVQLGTQLYIIIDRSVSESEQRFLQQLNLGKPLEPTQISNLELIPKIKRRDSANNNNLDFTGLRFISNEYYAIPFPLRRAPFKINLTSELVESLQSQNNDSLVINKPLGLGGISLSLVTDSYRYKLAGESELYSVLWKQMLPVIFHRDFSISANHLYEPILLKGQWVELCTESNEATFVTVHHESDTLDNNTSNHQTQSMLQLSQLSGSKLCNGFWPDRIGWYRVENSNNKDENWFYVHSNKNWQAQQQLTKQKATQSFVNTIHNYSERETANISIWKSSHLIPLLLLLLFSIWVIERRYNLD